MLFWGITYQDRVALMGLVYYRCIQLKIQARNDFSGINTHDLILICSLSPLFDKAMPLTTPSTGYFVCLRSWTRRWAQCWGRSWARRWAYSCDEGRTLSQCTTVLIFLLHRSCSELLTRFLTNSRTNSRACSCKMQPVTRHIQHED